MAKITAVSDKPVVVTCEIDVQCEKCGKDLNDTLVIVGRTIKVPPCEDCMEASYDEGNRDGYNQCSEHDH